MVSASARGRCLQTTDWSACQGRFWSLGEAALELDLKQEPPVRAFPVRGAPSRKERCVGLFPWSESDHPEALRLSIFQYICPFEIMYKRFQGTLRFLRLMWCIVTDVSDERLLLSSASSTLCVYRASHHWRLEICNITPITWICSRQFGTYVED